MSDTIDVTYNVVASNVSVLDKYVQKLNKRAAKFGLEPIQFYIGNKFTKPINDVKVRTFCSVRLVGKSPHVGGWQFAATIQSAGEAGNILRTVPGFEDSIPVEYRTGDPTRCEQCGIKRYRVDTYIISHSETSEWKQVGSTCLQDFLSTLDAHAIAKSAEMWSLLREMCVSCSDEEYGSARRSEDLLDLEGALEWAAEATLRFGWVSRKASQESDKRATVDEALSALSVQGKPCDKHCHYDAHGCMTHWTPSDAAKPLAIKALQWARDWVDVALAKANASGVNTSEYVWNLHVVLANDVIPIRSYGLVASVIGVYQRQMERKEKERQEAESNTSEHVGTVGKREDFIVTVRSIRYVAGDWQETTVYTFTDQDGNVLVWWCSNGTTLEEGEVVTLKGTVKMHGDYKGVRQTTITRCKVLG